MRRHTHRWAPIPSIAVAALAAISFASCSESSIEPTYPVPEFGFGNGAPSGPHYNLNIIGVPKEKSVDGTGSEGHRIFVLLDGVTKILLCQTGLDAPLPDGTSTCGDLVGFQVLDFNGTDGTARFGLPAPDLDNDGITTYSVYARALGKPEGSATNQTCGYDPADPTTPICSTVILTLTRSKGQSKFTNVSKALLYVFADLDGDGTEERIPLFDSRLIDYFWEYTNTGLKLAQLRFYPCATDVTVDPVDESGCF